MRLALIFIALFALSVSSGAAQTEDPSVTPGEFLFCVIRSLPDGCSYWQARFHSASRHHNELNVCSLRPLRRRRSSHFIQAEKGKASYRQPSLIDWFPLSYLRPSSLLTYWSQIAELNKPWLTEHVRLNSSISLHFI